MSLEERMLERFTKERQRTSKGTAFNLEDEDELTHYGKSLSKLDDFDDVGLLDDDEDEKGMLFHVDLTSLSHIPKAKLMQTLSGRFTLVGSAMRRRMMIIWKALVCCSAAACYL